MDFPDDPTISILVRHNKGELLISLLAIQAKIRESLSMVMLVEMQLLFHFDILGFGCNDRPNRISLNNRELLIVALLDGAILNLIRRESVSYFIHFASYNGN